MFKTGLSKSFSVYPSKTKSICIQNVMHVMLANPNGATFVTYQHLSSFEGYMELFISHLCICPKHLFYKKLYHILVFAKNVLKCLLKGAYTPMAVHQSIIVNVDMDK